MSQQEARVALEAAYKAAQQGNPPAGDQVSDLKGKAGALSLCNSFKLGGEKDATYVQWVNGLKESGRIAHVLSYSCSSSRDLTQSID